MPEHEVVIKISSNNSEMEKLFLDNDLHPNIRFSTKKITPYFVFLVDLHKDLTSISQKLIETYGLCREADAKLAVIILHDKKIDIEKNHYFQRMLDDLGKDKPLHRLVFTKDLYQTQSSTPITPLDEFLSQAISQRKINISQKGENLFYPLSTSDFINSLTKIFFLTHTSGKTFWLLGDPLLDLELSYLLKNYLSMVGQEELEINAEHHNDLKTNSLLSLGNKTRAELNWQPNSEIVDDLKLIVAQYLDAPVIETKQIKKNYLHELINWLYRPKPKKSPQLPTLKRVGFSLLKTIIIFGIIYSLIFVLATGNALFQLNRSVKYALNGNLQKSVSTLNHSQNSKAVGESLLDSASPITNLISSRGTEKLYNLYSFVNYSSTSLSNLQQTYVLADNLLQSLNSPENTVNYDDLSLALHSNLSQVYENLNQIAFLTNNHKLPALLENQINNNPEFKKLSILEEQIAQFMKVTDLIPLILSGDQPKNILVLLQNSQILRPSGGQIDYYILLSINKGQLLSKKYYIKEEIEKLVTATPSSSLKNKRFAQAPEPALKDITQNPDFAELSASVSAYIDKTLRLKPDFVFAINDQLIKQLLVEEKSSSLDRFEADLVTSSGSTAHKELFDQYLDRLFSQKISLPIIGRTLAKTIGDNQIFLWAADKNTQSLIASQSFSGVISIHSCNASINSSQNCLSQSAYLNDSVFIPSRQNPWSKRLVTHQITLNTNTLLHEYTLEYETANSEASSSATHTYNLYLSSPSSIDQILLNDLPSSAKEIQKTSTGYIDRYTLSIVHQLSQNAKLQIKATTYSEKNISYPFSYSLTEYRQPGTLDDGINLKINYTENLRPSVATSQFTALPQQMSLLLPPHTSTFGFTLVENRQ